jgi:hypothetical protein
MQHGARTLQQHLFIMVNGLLVLMTCQPAAA